MKWWEGDREIDCKLVAEWSVHFSREDDLIYCSHCGMWAPFARYQKGNGTNARAVTKFCPSCGAKMIALPQCKKCENHDVKDDRIVWRDDGICFGCRAHYWIPKKPHPIRGSYSYELTVAEEEPNDD